MIKIYYPIFPIIHSLQACKIPLHFVNIQAVLFKNALNANYTRVFPECKYVFIKDCETLFTINNITKDIFPKLKYIGIHEETNQFIKDQLLLRVYYNNYKIINYNEINNFYFFPYNKVTFCGIKKF